MSIIESMILGIVQGLTEFLPVSSSGHLVVLQEFLGIKEPGVTREVFLHCGTLMAVLWVFRKDFVGLFSFRSGGEPKKLLFLLLVGSIPTGIIGLLIKAYFSELLESALFTGLMLIGTGLLLYAVNLLPPVGKNITAVKTSDVLWVGFLQGASVLPGVSRSGATIFASLARGLSRSAAIKLSFMLAVPAIIGATALELIQGGWEEAGTWNHALGGAGAFIFGIAAIKWLVAALNKNKLHYFSYYCWILGVVILGHFY